MKYFYNYLEFMKLHRVEIKNTKLFLLIIVNIWLLLIFWKILLISDASIINNNATLTTAIVLLQPIISILGIDVFSPNMLKMMVLTFIVMATNISILYFNQVASIIVLTVFARYGYKSYTNYLKNQDNLNYLGFESKKEIIKQAESSSIIIENTPVVTEAVNHTHWGVWLVMGLVVVVCFGLLVYSHNNLNQNLITTNEILKESTTNMQNQFVNLDKKTTHMNSQIDLIFDNHGKSLDNLAINDQLLSNRMDIAEGSVQILGEQFVKIESLTNQNVLKLSQQSLNLSQEAADSLREISVTTSSVEAISVGFARVWEIVKGLGDRVEVTEARMNSLAGTEANIPNTINNKKNG